MRTGLILDWRRTRQQVVQQKFALRVKARLNPFRDWAGCTIAMRWQRRLRGNSSEDKNSSYCNPPGAQLTFSASILPRSTISLRSQTEELLPSRKKSFSCRTKRFGDPQRCLRTSHATWLKMAGADVKDAQAQMRHSRASTTLDIYQQFTPESQRRPVDRLTSLTLMVQ